MQKKMYFFFLLIICQRILIGSEELTQVPDFLKAFYTKVDPTKIHIGLYKGITYDGKKELDIILYNPNAQNVNVDDSYFKNMMTNFDNLDRKSSFKLIKQDNRYNICINNYTIAQINKKYLKNISTIAFGYLIEDEQMQHYRDIHYPGLQKKINSLHLLFADTSNFTYENNEIQLIKQPREGRIKGFASTGLTNLSEGYNKVAQNIKQTNYNLLSQNLLKTEQNNSQKQDTENKVEATDTCDKLEPKTEKHNRYLIYIAGSLSIIMIIVLAKLFVVNKIYV